MKVKFILGCLALLIAASACNAQQYLDWSLTEALRTKTLPAKPEPIERQPGEPPDHFFDTKGKIAIGVNAALTTLDAVGTCRTLAAGGHEHWLPTQHCAPASALMFGGFAFDISLSYVFHRTHHHKLERAMEMVGSANSLSGVVYTTTHDGKW
jgi:hypothetical protein